MSEGKVDISRSITSDKTKPKFGLGPLGQGILERPTLTNITVIDAADKISSQIGDLREKINDKENELKAMYIDPITGLASNSALSRDLKEIKKQAVTGELSEVSFFIIDADYFKYINTIYGHDFGDVMLNVYGQLINFSIDQQTVSIYRRTKGDEFVGLISEPKENTESDFVKKLNHNIEFFNNLESSSTPTEQMDSSQKEILNFFNGLPEELKDFKKQGLLLPVSLSIGSSNCIFTDVKNTQITDREKLVSDRIGQMFKDADDNLYSAKNNKNVRVKPLVLSVLEKLLSSATNLDQQKRVQECINDINSK